MQFHRVNNKEHQHSLVVSTFLHMHMRQNSMSSSFEGFLYLLWTWTCSIVRRGSSWAGQFSPPLPSLFHCLFSVTGACFPFLCGGSWLSCQDLPAMGEVSIKELAANTGSSRMFQAPKLHLVVQLLIYCLEVFFFTLIQKLIFQNNFQILMHSI